MVPLGLTSLTLPPPGAQVHVYITGVSMCSGTHSRCTHGHRPHPYLGPRARVTDPRGANTGQPPRTADPDRHGLSRLCDPSGCDLIHGRLQWPSLPLHPN